MKLKSFILSLITVTFCLFSCQEEKSKNTEISTLEIGDLTISKAKPKPGDTLTLTYTKPQDNAEVFYQTGKNLYAQDLQFIRKENNYQTEIILPDSTKVFAINFEKDGNVENNKNSGYIVNIYNEDGSLVPGSKSSKAFLYHKYGNMLELQSPEDSLTNLMKSDIENYPEIEENWDYEYYQILNSENPERAKDYAIKRINFYKKNKKLSEEENIKLINFQKAINENVSAEKLKSQILIDFPKGELMKETLLDSFSNTKTIEEKINVLIELNKTYNKKDIEKEKDYMFSTIAREYFNQDDFRRFVKYSMEIRNEITLANLYNSTAWDMAEKNENLDEAARISKKSLDIISKEKETLTKKPSYLSPSKYRKRINYDYQMFADTYAYILSKQGKIKEALEYQKIAIGKGEQADVNERYIQLLKEAEMYKAAEDASSKFIANNQATQSIEEIYKEMFLKNNSNVSEASYRKKLNELENQARFKLFEKIKKEKLNKKAPNFNLKNSKGKVISLEDFKGKTVVLDFWATWCGPCKASFPGMKRALEKYKDKSNVVFLFVNTFENGEINERISSAEEFINNNDYPFYVVYDQKKENSKEFSTANNFGISGIPTKVIIDPNGNINFKKVGYSGNNEKMLQEIDIMIELSQQ